MLPPSPSFLSLAPTLCPYTSNDNSDSPLDQRTASDWPPEGTALSPNRCILVALLHVTNPPPPHHLLPHPVPLLPLLPQPLCPPCPRSAWPSPSPLPGGPLAGHLLPFSTPHPHTVSLRFGSPQPCPRTIHPGLSGHLPSQILRGSARQTGWHISQWLDPQGPTHVATQEGPEKGAGSAMRRPTLVAPATRRLTRWGCTLPGRRWWCS